MSTAGRKAVRDLLGHGGRTALVVLAIAAGISAFTAVLASDAILRRALNEGYAATHPASATLRLDGVDGPLLAAVRANPEVGAAEARRAVRGRIHGPAGWRNLVLFAAGDWGRVRIGTITPEKGTWPPRAGEILVERDAFSVLRAGIGDTVLVRTDRGEPSPLRIAGSVHDVGQAQARMENVVYAYAALDTLERLGEGRSLDRLAIVVARRPFDEAHVRRVAEDVRRTAEGLGHAVRRVDIPKPGEHPHAAIMGMLMLVIAGFGLFALLLSGVLVINLMTAVLAEQVRQVGIMQAIGGTRARIASIYLRQALALGATAIAVALPAGLAGSRSLCLAMARFLNFDVVNWAVPIRVFVLVGAVGLLVPVAAAAWPVWRGTGVPIREALGDFGVARQAFGTTAFDRWVAGVGGTARPILLSIRNGFRKRGRLALTVATLAAAGVFFLSALNVRASMIRTLDRLFAGRRFDLSVGLASVAPGEAIERAIARTPGIARAEGWIAVEAAVAEGRNAAGASAGSAGPASHDGGSGLPGGSPHGAAAASPGRFTVLAIPPATPFLRMEIVRGRALASGEDDAIVANTALAAMDPRFRVGNTVAIRLGPGTVRRRVVGIAREPFSPPVAYVAKSYFDAFHPGGANTLRIALSRADAGSIDRAKEDLDRNLAAVGVRVVSATSLAEGRFGFDQHMAMIYVFLIVVSALLGGVGGLGLMTTMSLSVLERRRELGVLRAIGATPSAVVAMLVAEGAVVGLMSWGAAVAAAWPVSRGAGDFVAGTMFKTGLDFAFEARGAAVWLAVSLGFGAVATLGPAWKASRRPVREAFE